jgi:hypothetical protein
LASRGINSSVSAHHKSYYLNKQEEEDHYTPGSTNNTTSILRMVARCPPRVNGEGRAPKRRDEKIENWNDPVHCLGSSILHVVFLGILPQKNCTQSRTRTNMAPSRGRYIRPYESTPTKHNLTTFFRGFGNMSSP